jgi:amino acid transporter
MTSTGIDVHGSAMPDYIASVGETGPPNCNKKNEEAQIQSSDLESMSVKAGDHTHRQLRLRHIQLIGIGGTIGTALYVQIGHGLINGGPASLFTAFTIWYVWVPWSADQ